LTQAHFLLDNIPANVEYGAEFEEPRMKEYPPRRPPDPVVLTLGARLACGVVAGVLLGTADGVLLHHLTGVPDSPLEAGRSGLLLGAGSGVLFVLLERAARGRQPGVAIGTVLGGLFGLVPALVILTQGNGGGKAFVGLVLAPLAGGFILGGFLDRCFEALARRAVPDEADPARPED
jgi:hypothetical protein